MGNIQLGKLLTSGIKWLSIVFGIGVLFFLISFPTGDLGDFVSTKVSEVSQNQVFLQFSEFGFNLFPPALNFEQVYVETPYLPALTTENLSISPSISSMISKKPYGSVYADGLFKGEVKIQLKKGTSTENIPERHRLIVNAEKLDLKALHDGFNLPVALNGFLNLNLDAQADPNMAEQPEADVLITIDNFVLPTATVSTMMGPLTLPEIKLERVEIKGRLSNGSLIIEQGDIGNTKDELTGKIKGNWALSINAAQGFAPNLGAYNFDIDLTTKKSFQTKAGLFLSLLDSYKSAAGDSARYHFKVSAANLDSPPDITAAR
jgi:type II secretion system protein N